MVVVMLRGLVAGPVAGATCGLAVGVLLVGVPVGSGSPADGVAAVGFAGWLGAIVGAVVGVPSAILLALASPFVPDPQYAALTGLGVAATTGLVATLVASGVVWQGVVFGGVCGIVGSVVGRWVLFGTRRRVQV